MAFRKPGWLMVALVSALMAGCGSKTEPSKSNFANAIEDHLEKDGRFCVGKSFKFPVHLETGSSRISVGEMEAEIGV